MGERSGGKREIRIETFFLFFVVVSFYCSSLCLEAQNLFFLAGGVKKSKQEVGFKRYSGSNAIEP
jgi:hypothetical protein